MKNQLYKLSCGAYFASLGPLSLLYCSLLVHTGSYWALMGPIEPYWALLGPIKPYWALLGALLHLLTD